MQKITPKDVLKRIAELEKEKLAMIRGFDGNIAFQKKILVQLEAAKDKQKGVCKVCKIELTTENRFEPIFVKNLSTQFCAVCAEESIRCS